MIVLFIFLFTFPFMLIGWSFIDVKNGKRDKINWKLPLLIAIMLMVGSVIGQFYLLSTYDLPLFLSSNDSMIAFLVIGIFLGIIALVNIVVTIICRKNNVPKELHNSSTVWKFIGVLGVTIFVFLLWFMPLAEKIDYVLALHDAIDTVSSDEEAEFSIALVRSEPDCLRARNCTNMRYDNQFFIKNNLDETKEVQFIIRAFNEEQNELKTIESNLITIKPRELLLLETDETITNSSIWDRYSFKTDEEVYSFQYKFQYRDSK
ncbi:hypothetical protein [Bacillus sp. JCM 19034]|uniref:hypothetical protein n=1 Tax=Bacillus sp. JCM 19034 TaxID=1481928 RepID=UPI000782375F|nr:hypothetical protein [Bacillus sp. JCM 19034]